MTSPGLLLRRARLLGGGGAGGGGPVDVLVRDGRVAAVGPGAGDHAAGAGASPEVVDLGGRVVMPGLWDAHVHLTQWALVRRRVDVSGATSAAQAAALMRDHLAVTGPPAAGTALVGHGFRDGLWPDRPTAALLDSAVGEVPVVLVAADLHSAWASTAGLRFLGVEHPTGLLREAEWMAAMGALDAVPDDVADALVAEAVRAVAARGVVGVVDLEIADNVAVWSRRITAGTDALRVRAGVWPNLLDAAIAAGRRTGEVVEGTGGLLAQGPLKVITDGSLNTRTAYCRHPYGDPPGRGVLSVPLDELTGLLRRARAAGLAAAVHAIGDAAVGLALDAFEATGARGSIEHAQLMTAGDVARTAALGLVASVQPEHLVDDRDVTDRYWADRAGLAFPLRDLHAAGVPLVLGSDAPVAPLDPWAAVAAAVTRTRDGREPWHPEQAVGVLTALAASVDGRPLGLAPGMPADLAVLDADPVAIAGAGDAGGSGGAGAGKGSGGAGRGGTDSTPDRDPAAVSDALRAMPVAATLLAGRWTHRAL